MAQELKSMKVKKNPKPVLEIQMWLVDWFGNQMLDCCLIDLSQIRIPRVF